MQIIVSLQKVGNCSDEELTACNFHHYPHFYERNPLIHYQSQFFRFERHLCEKK